ncbi:MULTISPECIES: GNAT family N-acetyltransferase [unclassified Microbacterium]|uniref:GNAT family N-acetyltransferase n=1 Tax=unclassified Microbacterium TaxID=2609290 RepID=UPI0024686F26|nr:MULTISPECIES: GNAT family N-acetyltransferase [unclassified Microbacterium]MDH5134520.1 GNAT family N-acetyltransferase [Microbacterium sp. RD10]MDH5136934.1 GNAT family N-acetyltransferase [Microbacterium sp. RD11]MDH5146032.1 GNAT family N-acetyltransferase [Microbacterium sp. RD12]MDH5153322.1 GNAT family N-acetyltransferase [Microbacterium sp. RD06]MDH5167210.1 GNAT family N-acetyltransferase [Microbacterium sp. RD02]
MDTLSLRPWSADDLPLLRAANTPEMTVHLNGPESTAEVQARHERYLRLVADGEALMFAIIDDEGQPLGSIGAWRITWQDEPAWETGWFVLPAAQGRRVAARALALLVDVLRGRVGDGRLLLAFPAVDNPASNAVCRRGGFTRRGTITEDFRGAELTVNEWVLDLAADSSTG